MAAENLIKQFHAFLKSSSKNTEQFDSELLEAIAIDTSLDKVVADAIRGGKDIVIAGTAGSGKTHLLRSLEKHLTDESIVEFGDQPKSEKHIRTIADLTAIPPDQQEKVFERTDGCSSVVVAANEGALLAAQRDVQELRTRQTFEKAVEFLHRIQRGDSVHDELTNLVVVDAAGFDPSSDNVVENILQLDVVTDFVTSGAACVPGCEGDESDCARKQAWKHLRSSEVRNRLSQVIAAASVDAEGFTFRTIWNFIADLLIGGECNPTHSQVPTSPWFWRLFNGDSSVAQHVARLFPPHRFVVPHAETHLWYGDWLWFQSDDRINDDLILMRSSRPPCDLTAPGMADQAFVWLKLQLLFMANENPFTAGITSTDAAGLWEAACQGDHSSILRMINAYMLYGFSSPETKLNLWVDYAMEQRGSRPDGQVSLGEVKPEEFEIARSISVANTAMKSPPRGSRIYLRHKASGAALSLTRETLARIGQGRSPRTVDRENTELDWELMNYFSAIARTSADLAELRIALFNFTNRD